MAAPPKGCCCPAVPSVAAAAAASFGAANRAWDGLGAGTCSRDGRVARALGMAGDAAPEGGSGSSRERERNRGSPPGHACPWCAAKGPATVGAGGAACPRAGEAEGRMTCAPCPRAGEAEWWGTLATLKVADADLVGASRGGLKWFVRAAAKHVDGGTPAPERAPGRGDG